jgi:hypothetical protein
VDAYLQACVTFLTIVKKCKETISVIREDDTEPFTIKVINTISSTISDLSTPQVLRLRLILSERPDPNILRSYGSLGEPISL